MSEEVWKDIEGYEDYYAVSDQGQVKSLTRVSIGSKGRPLTTRERILKPGLRGGYPTVRLNRNNIGKSYPIHRLVAIAFIPNPNNLPEVNHKDENLLNPVKTNLEWCTRLYNVNYGTASIRAHENMSPSSLTRPVIAQRADQKLEFKSIHEAGRELGLSAQNISSVIRGNRSRTTGGWTFSYKEV